MNSTRTFISILTLFRKVKKNANLFKKSKKTQMKDINLKKILNQLMPIATKYNEIHEDMLNWNTSDFVALKKYIIQFFNLYKNFPKVSSFSSNLRNQKIIPLLQFFKLLLEGLKNMIYIALRVTSEKIKIQEQENISKRTRGLADEFIEMTGTVYFYTVVPETIIINRVVYILLDDLYDWFINDNMFIKGNVVCESRKSIISTLSTTYTNAWNNYISIMIEKGDPYKSTIIEPPSEFFGDLEYELSAAEEDLSEADNEAMEAQNEDIQETTNESENEEDESEVEESIEDDLNDAEDDLANADDELEDAEDQLENLDTNLDELNSNPIEDDEIGDDLDDAEEDLADAEDTVSEADDQIESSEEYL